MYITPETPDFQTPLPAQRDLSDKAQLLRRPGGSQRESGRFARIDSQNTKNEAICANRPQTQRVSNAALANAALVF